MCFHAREEKKHPRMMQKAITKDMLSAIVTERDRILPADKET